jgi:hypothetical protein
MTRSKEISDKQNYRARLLLAALALVVIGLGIVGDASAQERRRRLFEPGRFERAGQQLPPRLGAGGRFARVAPFAARGRNAIEARPFRLAPQFERQRAVIATQNRLARTRLPLHPLPGARGFTGVPPRDETRFVGNEMVFHVAADVSPQTVDDAARRLGLSTLGSQNLSLGGTLFRFRIIDGRPVADVVRALEAEQLGVAQPNYVYKSQQEIAPAAARAAVSPNTAQQYVSNKLRLAEAHRLARGTGVTVAVIDSEIDARHPDLNGAVVERFDAIGSADKPHAHGTGMAGAIAAHRQLVGVAPGAKILAVHAFSPGADASAQATSEHILKGIDWAIKQGARVINMSFAGPYDPMLQVALQKAHDKGVVLVAAVGNMGPKSPPLYPAADPNVVGVTATDAADRLLPEANRGGDVMLAAPGVNIVEPAPNAAYQVTTGTSVAAAHISGVIALLLERKPDLDPETIRDVLSVTARDLGPKGRDDQFGWGLVDPYQALLALETNVARVPPGPEVRAPTPVNQGRALSAR